MMGKLPIAVEDGAFVYYRTVCAFCGGHMPMAFLFQGVCARCGVILEDAR